ncbi:MAG: glucose-6-phosphate isomerase family protein [Chthonomonadales bacterium]
MSVHFDPVTGKLSGDQVVLTARTIADLKGVFRDEAARERTDQSIVAYHVEAFEPVPEGTMGGVGLATTYLYAGTVGDEYYFTRGHYHKDEDRPELEVTISGEGYLVLMDRDRVTRVEEMRPGSVHPVGPGIAHRVANTGKDTLVFVSYWASETGHDYATIRERGFSARVRQVDSKPELMQVED